MRPKKLSGETVTVCFHLPKTEAAALKETCRRIGKSLSEVLRTLARHAVTTQAAPVDALTRLERIEEEARRLRDELTEK